MRNTLKYTFLLLSFWNTEIKAQSIRQLMVIMELEVPGETGQNGGTVAINLKNRNYYTTIAGRKSNPMTIFNGLSERISPADLALLYDIRGLWYHPGQKTFFANGFGNIGWVKYVIDEAGIPYDAKVVFEGMRQPFPQSVGHYSQKENLVYFLKGSTIVAYDGNTAEPVPAKNRLLKVGYTKKKPPPPDWKTDSFAIQQDYNSTTAIYTGIGRSEFGLLNIKSREIELYDAADGLMSVRLKIPDGIPVKEKLNFAFSNNFYWFFNTENRIWYGLR